MSVATVVAGTQGSARETSRYLGGLNHTDRMQVHLRYHTGAKVTQGHLTALRDLTDGKAVIADADGNAVPEHRVVICPQHDTKTLTAGMISSGFHDETNGVWFIANPRGREQLVTAASVRDASQYCPDSANDPRCANCQNRMMS